MNIAIVLFFFCSALLAKADEYDFDYDYDYWGSDYDYCHEDNYYDYLVCEGDFCTDETQGVSKETVVPIPETNLTHLDYKYFDVLTVSAIKECTPTLGIKV